jgi:hypothetical protein
MTVIFTDKMGISQARNEVLGTSALSRKGPATFIMFVRPPSVLIYQRRSHCTDCCEILYWGLLRKSIETFQIWLKSGTLHEDLSMLYCCRGRYIASKVFSSSAIALGC